MPTRLPRACRIPTCPHPAVSRGRCTQHAQHNYADRNRFAWVYHDRRWPPLSEQVRREEPFCTLKLPGCTVLTDLAEHRVPHRGDEQLAFARSNLRGACRSCNSRKGRRREGGGEYRSVSTHSAGRPEVSEAHAVIESIEKGNDAGDQ